MDDELLMNVCVVGGNAVSAFLSWRLQATNACDVTLVWKSGFESVYQYGISFKYGRSQGVTWRFGSQLIYTHRSTAFGNERFKPRHGTISIKRCKVWELITDMLFLSCPNTGRSI